MVIKKLVGFRTKLLIILFIIATAFVGLFTYFSLNPINSAKAQSSQSDLLVKVDSILELKLSTCNSINNSLVEVNIEPSIEGTFKSNCQEVFINTNAPGYSLSTKASSTTLDYINPTSLNPKPTINPTTNTTTAPNTLTNDTWGFAVEGKPNFDTTYTIDNANNKYAQLLTTDIPIYSESGFPLTTTDHKFFYAARLTPSTMAGGYATTVTYTATPELPTPPPMTCNHHPKAPECIEFTVDVGDTGTYSIPTSGRVANMDHTYDWDVYVDGYLTNDCNNGNCTGTSSLTSSGIPLTNLSNGQHKILIVNHDESIPGWGNAFGHYTESEGANTAVNKNKLITLNSPLTTMAFSPKVSESTTDASFMFARIFQGCTNLTTPATIVDTYKLPSAITNLSYFLYYTHAKNSTLELPINVASLENWLYSNNSITNLSVFLYHTHESNSILSSPINLAPIANWFNFNTSITNLSYFLDSTHTHNSILRDPVNLEPLTNWFNSNSSITNLMYFMAYVHNANYDMRKTVNLLPITNWFNGNNSVSNMQSFFSAVHGQSNYLQDPVDLSPLVNWFKSNTSINNLSNFFMNAHTTSLAISSPIDFTPLSAWFSADRSFANLSGFLNSTHNNNPRLNLSGQIILPNWIKTAKEGATDIWNVENAFTRTFCELSSKSDDTAEIRFQDGTSVLSSIGEPSAYRNTYNNRAGISPLNNNNGRWKSN